MENWGANDLLIFMWNCILLLVICLVENWWVDLVICYSYIFVWAIRLLFARGGASAITDCNLSLYSKNCVLRTPLAAAIKMCPGNTVYINLLFIIKPSLVTVLWSEFVLSSEGPDIAGFTVYGLPGMWLLTKFIFQWWILHFPCSLLDITCSRLLTCPYMRFFSHTIMDRHFGSF